MKGQKMLKVTSILMIIGGVIAIIAGVIAILGISALAALAGGTEGMGMLYASTILVIVASVIQPSPASRASAPATPPEGCFLRQVGHRHCGLNGNLHRPRPGGRR